MDLWASILRTATGGWGWVIAFAFILTLIELVAHEERTSSRARIRAVTFWTVWIPFSVMASAIISAIWGAIGVQPLLSLPIAASLRWTGPLALVLSPIISAMVFDFFFYWFHRIQHRWLWRFHAVHHSIRELHGASGYHHITEGVFRTLLMIIPASLISRDVGPALPAIGLLLAFQQSYVHSSTSACLGWGRVLFVDNRFHRIHHSLDERHFDKNFGAMTTFWDRLFGTAYWPKKDEWPAVGLAEIDEPHTVREFIDLPFRFGAKVVKIPAPAE